MTMTTADFFPVSPLHCSNVFPSYCSPCSMAVVDVGVTRTGLLAPVFQTQLSQDQLWHLGMLHLSPALSLNDLALSSFPCTIPKSTTLCHSCWQIPISEQGDPTYVSKCRIPKPNQSSNLPVQPPKPVVFSHRDTGLMKHGGMLDRYYACIYNPKGSQIMHTESERQ